MPAVYDANPTRQEIERQLERMLASDVFRARPQQAKVFEFIVRAAMAKKEIGEKDIRARFYPTPPYDPESTVIRTTVNFIRSKLVREYYELSGEDDPVIISLPPRPAKALRPAPGKAYQPVFSYNPRSVADHAYREGMHHLHNMFSVFDFSGASQFFDQAIAASPAFAPAYAARAEMEVMSPMLLPYASPVRSLARARLMARKALNRNPRSWRAHVVLAAVHTCRREWKQAKDEFNRALRLEPDETRYHPWYAAFLMATGRENEALELTARRAEERPEDPFAHAIWGLFAYVARDFDTAESLLSEAVSKNPRNWVACFAYACLRVQQKRTDGLSERLVFKAHDTLSMDVFPGLRILCLRAVSPPNEETLDFEIGLIAKSNSEHDYWSPLQMALGQIAYGEVDEALASLSEAFNDRNPFMAWLHLWPFLDPLRADKRFERLVTRMRLPHVN